MTDYLLDTNVISALAPGRRDAHRALAEWIVDNRDTLYLSVVTPIEIEIGIRGLGRKSPGRRHRMMMDWYAQLDGEFRARIIPLTRDMIGDAATIALDRKALGLSADWPDILIAATARRHKMTLLTRNLRHFAEAGIPVVDPFSTLP